MNEKRSFVPWVILVVLIIAGVVIYLVSTKASVFKKTATKTTSTTDTTTTSSEKNLTNIDPNEVSDKAKQTFAMAQEKAAAWHANAAFVYAQYKFTSLNVGEGQETFVFDSPAEPNSHFTFTISQKSQRYIRATIPVADYLGTGLLPIDIKYWKVNYDYILQAAEKAGGKDFRDKYLNWSIEISLKRDKPNNWLYYIVDYKTEVGDSLSLKFDANSGAAVKETGSGT